MGITQTSRRGRGLVLSLNGKCNMDVNVPLFALLPGYFHSLKTYTITPNRIMVSEVHRLTGRIGDLPVQPQYPYSAVTVTTSTRPTRPKNVITGAGRRKAGNKDVRARHDGRTRLTQKVKKPKERSAPCVGACISYLSLNSTQLSGEISIN